jgi:hypothetical protein
MLSCRSGNSSDQIFTANPLKTLAILVGMKGLKQLVTHSSLIERFAKQLSSIDRVKTDSVMALDDNENGGEP